MDLAALRRFVAAADVGCFGRAAETLHVTQPAITRSIKLLEDELDVRLFERHARGVTLTSYGETFLAHARCLVQDADRAVSHLRMSTGFAHGAVVIGVTPFQTETVMAPVIAAFLEEFPDVEIRVVTGDSIELADALREGRLDLALAPSEPGALTPDVERIPGPAVRTVAVVRAGHPLLARGGTHKFSLAELSDVTWSVVDLHGAKVDIVRAFDRAGVPLPRIAVASKSITLLKRLVARTDHLAILDVDTIREEVERGILRIVPTNPPEIALPVWILVRRRAARAPHVECLVRLLRGRTAGDSAAVLPSERWAAT